MSDAFYTADGDAFVSSPLTTGPWSVQHQHAGPPSALLTRALEARLAEPDAGAGELEIVRLTCELLRPVPVAPLRVDVWDQGGGRRARRLEGRLYAGDRECVRCVALAMRRAAVSFDPPAAAPPAPAMPAPSDCPPVAFPFFDAQVGYHTAMELRIGRGGIGQGVAAAWLRMRHPLVAGESPSPLQRVVIAADSGNGVSAALDWRRTVFINPDLTVHVHRLPEGEWVGLDARTWTSGTHVGLAESLLHDTRGPIGRATQTLLLDHAG